MDKTIIALPLIEILKKTKGPVDVIIDLNLNVGGGRDEAQKRIIDLIGRLDGIKRSLSAVKLKKTELSTQYVFASLSGKEIQALLVLDAKTERAIYEFIHMFMSCCSRMSPSVSQ